MGVRIPFIKIKILLESNPLKSRILVRRCAVLRRRARVPRVPSSFGGGRRGGLAEMVVCVCVSITYYHYNYYYLYYYDLY